MILEPTLIDGQGLWYHTVVKHTHNIFDTCIKGGNIYIVVKHRHFIFDPCIKGGYIYIYIFIYLRNTNQPCSIILSGKIYIGSDQSPIHNAFWSIL